MKVVILGKGLMLANAILGASEAGADIVGVFRYEYTQKNKWQVFIDDFFHSNPEVTLIKKINLKQIKLKSANSEEFQKLMIKLNVDLIIIATWSELICKKTYDIPTIATVNIHPSLLPKYRGPNPYLQTILHGEKYSGVSIHLINEKFDQGPILKQEKIKILDTFTSKELREQTVKKARNLVNELINDLNRGIFASVCQNESKSSYYKNISGEERMLDFTIQSSEEISRTIRALHPFLPSYITHKRDFFIVDPYNFRILDEIYKDTLPGTIIYKNPNKKSVSIICKDNKPICFENLKLYKKNNTKQYILKKVQCNNM